MLIQNSKEQVALVLDHESENTVSSDIAPSRQREVADTVENARIEKTLCAANDKLGSMCFAHHADDILSGNHDYLGLSFF